MNTERFDVYTVVHKGLRKALFDLGYAIGRTDAENDAELDALRIQCAEVLHFLDEHGENENRYQLALLEQKCPGAASHNFEEHEEIEAMVRNLESRLQAVVEAPHKQRRPMLRAYYGLYHKFVSRYLLHMEEEETETTKLLHEYCTDEELAEQTQKIIQRTPPADMGMMLKYMIPSMNGPERIKLLGEMKQGAPPEAFHGVKALAQQVLHPGEWAGIEQGIA